MFKVKAVAAVAMALAAAGAAQAVQVDYRGQVLLAPIYLTTGGYSTNVKVVNHDTTSAVKAKLVLRSQKHSQECRDVILYLSPGDVAEVDLTANSNAKHATITSTDDSLLSGLDGTTPIFASNRAYSSVTSGANLLPTEASTADTCAVGHIEVIGAYRVSGVVATDAGNVTVRQGMTKGDLYKIFSSDAARLRALNPSLATITSENVNSLSAVVDLHNASGDSTSIQATALRSETTVVDLISNRAGNVPFDVLTSAETLIGLGWLAGLDSLANIEAALGSTVLSSVYQKAAGQETNLIMTFPTRYRYLTSRTALTYAPPFQSNGSYAYTVESFDNFENSRQVAGCFESPCAVGTQSFISDEVNYIVTAGINNFFFADKGWFRLTLTPAVSAGAPGSDRAASVLGYTHRFKGQQSVVNELVR